MTEVDSVLIDAVVTHRSERAARALVERHSPRLLAVVRRLLANDASAAEDVVQQAWVNGIAALRTFRGDASFSTWMTRIAVRVTLDHVRRGSGLRDAVPETLTAEWPAPSHNLDERLDLERLIARLPPACRGVLVLHDIEGFTHEEIGATLDIAAGTSKAQLFRARRLLRRWLTHDTDEKEVMP